ncbi:MAG: hypothetical protein ACYDH9_22920 [Limisphaerales bacterium]
MNATPEKPGMLQRSSLVRFTRWLCTWRNLRRFLIGAASVITFIALVYALIDWRARRAWEQYQQEMEAKGERLDLAAFIPKPVPDDQNFAMTPFLKPLFDFVPGTQTWRDTNAFQRTFGFAKDLASDIDPGNWRLGKPASFATPPRKSSRSSAGLPAPAPVGDAADRKKMAVALLEKMSVYTPVLDELRAASHRPYSRFNTYYENGDKSAILLPHLAVVKRVCRVSALRASAELALGRTDEALNDIDLTLYLADSLKGEPILISQLVRLAGLGIAMQPIWEGLEARQWSDAQLQILEKRLEQFHLLADAEFALRGERAFGNSIIEWLRGDLRNLAHFGMVDEGSGPKGGFTVPNLFPRGWLRWEQLHYNQSFNQVALPGIDVAAGRVYPDRLEQETAAVNKLMHNKTEMFFHHRILTGMLLPAIRSVHVKFAFAQSFVGEAVVACALERYRQAQGRFPETLDPLAPRFIDKLPSDVITGQLLTYRRTDDGRFVLYSIGWNLKDDGGQVGLSKGTRPGADISKGDWVWQYPVKQ